MFGGSGIMVDFELDRYFLFPAGQFGVTASLGFMGKTAKAFRTEDCSSGETGCVDGKKPVIMDGELARTAEKTSFRLLPISIGAVYRFTRLDDRFRVPIVPYGRAGVAYYLWWITGPDGSIAEYPDDGGRALGASLGVEASVGLALRAERLDKQAALSLRNDTGIEHAGFYVELNYAWVDGFGSDKKLPVGDLTWFAGLNFEF